jgi:hypothetical protein
MNSSFGGKIFEYVLQRVRKTDQALDQTTSRLQSAPHSSQPLKNVISWFFKVCAFTNATCRHYDAVLSLPDHGGAVGYAPVHHLNLRYGDASERFTPLQKVAAVVAGEVGGRLLLTVPLLGGGGGGGGRFEIDDGAAETVGAGIVLEGVVREVQAMQAIVTLPGGRRGRLHATEVGGEEEESAFPLRGMAVGAVLSVVVLGPAGDRGGAVHVESS